MAKKNLVSGPILVHLTKFGHQFLFFSPKNLASSGTRYHGQLSSCTISEKNNDPILTKRSDGRADRRTRVISLDAVRLTSCVQSELTTKYKSPTNYASTM